VALVETLADPFNQVSLDTGKWFQTVAGTTTMSYASGGATVNLPASATSTDIGSDGSNTSTYDLTGSYAYMQVTAVPSNSTSAYAALQLAVLATGYYLRWHKEGSNLYARYNTGSTTSAATLTYSATDHKWWRIRESGGTTYWDTSPDGTTWTNRASVLNATHAVPITSLRVTLQAGCWQVETSPGSFTFNDFNTPPGSTSGPNYAGSAADIGGGTGSWSNPSYATGTDNATYATWAVP
jgi:hypothetical protein